MELKPVFNDPNPGALLSHVGELTRQTATEHGEILSRLLDQIQPVDFEAEANPNNAENFKLSNKHYYVLSIEQVLQTAISNRWGLESISPSVSG